MPYPPRDKPGNSGAAALPRETARAVVTASMTCGGMIVVLVRLSTPLSSRMRSHFACRRSIRNNAATRGKKDAYKINNTRYNAPDSRIGIHGFVGQPVRDAPDPSLGCPSLREIPGRFGLRHVEEGARHSQGTEDALFHEVRVRAGVFPHDLCGRHIHLELDEPRA